MIEVFKTDVRDKWSATRLVILLSGHFPGCKINFDLDDCDKILRIEGEYFPSEILRMIVQKNGYNCEVLE